MKEKIYNLKGKEAGEINLPEEIFGVDWKADLVHQVATSMMSNLRHPVAHAKNRGEVSGGGKKPWKQKGTGRARHGSIRSPLWAGGGVTHGPLKEKNFTRKINKKMRWGALKSVLSCKLKDNEILFVEKITLAEPKTKDAKEIFQQLSSIKRFENLLNKKKNSVLMVLPEGNKIVEKSFNNFGNVEIVEIRNLNILHLLNNRVAIFSSPDDILSVLEKRAD